MIKISELNQATSVNDDDLLVVVADGETKKIEVGDLKTSGFVTTDTEQTITAQKTIEVTGIPATPFVVSNGGGNTISFKFSPGGYQQINLTASGGLYDTYGAGAGIGVSGYDAAVIFSGSSQTYGTIDNTGLHLNGKPISAINYSPAQITSTQNNLALNAKSLFIRLESDAVRTINGITAGADGELHYIRNIGSYNLIFTHQSGSATGAQIYLGGGSLEDVHLHPGQLATLIYDATSARWLFNIIANFITDSHGTFGDIHTWYYNGTSVVQFANTGIYVGGLGRPAITSSGIGLYDTAYFSAGNTGRIGFSSTVDGATTPSTYFSMPDADTARLTFADSTYINFKKTGIIENNLTKPTVAAATSFFTSYWSGDTSNPTMVLRNDSNVCGEIVLQLYTGTSKVWIGYSGFRTSSDVGFGIVNNTNAYGNVMSVQLSLAAAGVWDVTNEGMTAGTAFRFKPLSPSQIVADQTNYSAFIGGSKIVRLNTDASREIQGIAAGSDGVEHIFINVGSQNIVLKHDSGSATGKKIYCHGSADITLAPNDQATLLFDATSDVWRAR